MSKSEQNESPSAEKNTSDESKRDEFVEALKEKGDEGLKKAFHVLKKGGEGPTALVEDVDLRLAVAARDGKISVEKTKEIMQQLNKQEQGFTEEEFVCIVNVIVALVGVNKDEQLESAFLVLSKGGPTVGVKDVQLALTIRLGDGEVDFLQNAKETIQQVNKQGSFNSQEFLDIFKFVEALKEKGDEGLKKAFHVLKKGREGPTALVKDVDLRLAVAARDGKISVEKTKEIMQQLNKQEQGFTEEEFVCIVNVIVALVGVNKDEQLVLESAFRVLSKGGSTVDAKDVQLALTIRLGDGEVDSLQNAKETIQQVNKQGSFNSQEFLDIFKLLLEESREADQKEICESLKKMEEHEMFILYGEAGVGKTWTAREVANMAVRKHHFDAAIWVYLDRIYQHKMSLLISIAYQLSVLTDFEDYLAKAEEEKAKAEEAGKKAKAEEAGKKEPGKEEKLLSKEAAKTPEEMIVSLIVGAIKGKKILFILDSHGDQSRTKVEVGNKPKKMHLEKENDKSSDEKKKDGGEESIPDRGIKNTEERKEEKNEKGKEKEKEEKIVFLKLGGAEGREIDLCALESYRVLATETRNEVEQGKNGVMVKPFTWDQSKKWAARVKEGVEDQNQEEVEDLARYFMFRSKRLPSQILLISRIVSYHGKKGEKLGLEKLRNDRDTIKQVKNGVEDVLIKGYEERLPKSVLIDCYGPDKPENHFMRRGRAVTFNEVICYWIMEGHLGHFDRVDEAYHKGHGVLMELMDCGLLQKQEADCVVPSGITTFKFHIDDYKEFFSCIRPGIGITFDMNLGRVALADGMIRSTDRRISTLLLDGKRIGESERSTQSLLEHKDLVEILAISNPTSQHFKLPILEMQKLRLLALRGCKFLDNLERFVERKPDQGDKEKSPQTPSKSDEEKKKSSDEEKKKSSDGENKKSPQTPIPEKLEKLTVLEISGPNSQIETVPDPLFSLIPNLKTLNLSHLLKVKSLPSSFYILTQIEFLILRGCESLQELKSLKNFKDLKILDVSNSTSFEKFEDKSLHTNTKLQILNLSKTKLKTLPLINQLKELKFVWLRDCDELPRIRKIDNMGKLEIFDISGAGEVERFCDPSLEDLKNLIIIDISRTKIRRLPANLGDPTYLYAKDCLKLRVVPPVEELKKLQFLDLSGCIHLREVRKEFFTKVNDLRELNLSKTNVQDLPFLGGLSSLRRLLLSGCKRLGKVEKLSCLKELEFLDLSGCEKVMELEEGSFDGMKHLAHLNLSGTGIGGQQKPLPSLSKLESLKELHVRDCPNLTALPGVEKVITLEVLDHSGTVLESTPSFDEDHPPHKHKRVRGAGIESIDNIQLFEKLCAEKGDDEAQRWYFKHEEVKQCQWIISNWRVEVAEAEKLTPVYGAHFLRLLKEYPLFLTLNLSRFRFLVYPSQVDATVEERLSESYADELSLREIYFEQICEEKMERCMEIREFEELPESLHPVLARAQLVVLVNDPFLKSLLDLGVNSTMSMKACWIESCSKLVHVVAAPPVVDKTGEAEKSEGQKGKNAKMVEFPKGGGDQRNKIWEKPAAKEGSDQQLNAAKSREPAIAEGDQHMNAAAGCSGQGHQQKDSAEEKSAVPAKGEGNQQNSAAEEKPGDAAKSEGGQQTDEKSEEPAKNEVNQPADNSGESSKGEGNQQNNDAEEKPGDAAKSEGGQQTDEKSEEPAKNGVNQPADNSGESSKGEGNQQNNDAEEKPGDAAKTAPAVDTAKMGGDQPKNTEEDTSGVATNSEGDQQNMTAADTAKVGGDEQKNDAEEKSGVAAKGEGNQQKTAGAEEKLGGPAKNRGDQAKSVAAANSEKIGDDQQNNTVEQKLGEATKNEGEEAKNLAEDLNKLETLWISDVSKMKSLCEGDIKTVSFKFLKSLYLEFCPQLSAICSSYLQLQSLETLFIKYCPNMKSLFDEENPSKMEKLRHLQLWGLDKLQKINCKAPLDKLRVGECPLLEHVIASRLADEEAVGHENEGHEYLKILHIKSCDNLKNIFESDHDVVFERLEELELSGLPKLKKVAREVLALKVLRIAECPSLRNVIVADGARDLETLEVKACEKMEEIITGEGSKLEKVEKIKLLGLPELKRVGAKLPIKTVRVWACPKLEKSDPDFYK